MSYWLHPENKDPEPFRSLLNIIR